MPYYNGDLLVSPLLESPPVLVQTSAPSSSDNQYVLGQQWLDTTTNTLYYLTSAPLGVANWEILGSPTGAVATLTGDSGGAISPTGGNINIVTGANLTSVGSGSSITVSLDAAVDTTSVAVGTAALGLTLSTASIVADGTDSNIPITVTPKGTGDLLLTAGDLLASAGDVIAVRSQAAGDVTVEVTNSDNSNNASDAWFEAAVGGTSAGDAGIRFQISGGQAYSMGVDNSDSDNLVIAGSNDLGTDNLVTIADAGAVSVVKGNAIVSRSSAAGEVLVQVINSENADPASDAFVEVTCGGTSGGDAGIRFQVSGGQSYSMGLDNSDSDNLVISGSADIGTDNLVTIADAGDVSVVKGNLTIAATGKGLRMKGGVATDFVGVDTLTAGTATIANTNIATGDRIFLSRVDANASTTLGELSYTISNGASFTINSLILGTPGSVQTGDLSSVAYFIVRPV